VLKHGQRGVLSDADQLALCPQAFVAVYDGHNGVQTADYLESHMHLNVARNATVGDDLSDAIRAG
jgi:serine/threonine protein phosphatase PrpC